MGWPSSAAPSAGRRGSAAAEQAPQGSAVQRLGVGEGRGRGREGRGRGGEGGGEGRKERREERGGSRERKGREDRGGGSRNVTSTNKECLGRSIRAQNSEPATATWHSSPDIPASSPIPPNPPIPPKPPRPSMDAKGDWPAVLQKNKQINYTNRN